MASSGQEDLELISQYAPVNWRNRRQVRKKMYFPILPLCCQLTKSVQFSNRKAGEERQWERGKGKMSKQFQISQGNPSL